MQKPVADGRFVNIARFRIVDPKCLIRSVLVGLVKKLAVQGEDIIGQMKRKSFNIFTTALIS